MVQSRAAWSDWKETFFLCNISSCPAVDLPCEVGKNFMGDSAMICCRQVSLTAVHN